MRRVILESPFAATTIQGISENIDYARLCMRHSLERGEAPLASHLLYTQPGILDDDDPKERALGIAAGLAWRPAADLTAVYVDRGISGGMQAAMDSAAKEGRPVELRSIYGKIGERDD